MTAQLVGKHSTPRAIVQACRIRDCGIYPCEVQKDGEVLLPEDRLALDNGELLTVIVRSIRLQCRAPFHDTKPSLRGWLGPKAVEVTRAAIPQACRTAHRCEY